LNTFEKLSFGVSGNDKLAICQMHRKVYFIYSASLSFPQSSTLSSYHG